MKDVILVVEGGGQRLLDIALREAVDHFVGSVKTKVRASRKRWQVMLGHGRDDAYQEFLDLSARNPNALVVLLVDSEGSLEELSQAWSSRKKQARLFFMVQCMEAWIVADIDSLDKGLKGKLKSNALPKRPPEECSPEELRRALQKATEECGIGKYEKKHGPILLAMVRPEVVAQRCPSAGTFLQGLDALLSE